MADLSTMAVIVCFGMTGMGLALLWWTYSVIKAFNRLVQNTTVIFQEHTERLAIATCAVVVVLEDVRKMMQEKNLEPTDHPDLGVLGKIYEKELGASCSSQSEHRVLDIRGHLSAGVDRSGACETAVKRRRSD